MLDLVESMLYVYQVVRVEDEDVVNGLIFVLLFRLYGCVC